MESRLLNSIVSTIRNSCRKRMALVPLPSTISFTYHSPRELSMGRITGCRPPDTLWGILISRYWMQTGSKQNLLNWEFGIQMHCFSAWSRMLSFLSNDVELFPQGQQSVLGIGMMFFLFKNGSLGFFVAESILAGLFQVIAS